MIFETILSSQPPRLQHKAASQKLWTKRSSSTGGKEEKSWSSNTRKEEKEEETTQAPLKLQKENVVQKTSSAESEEEEVTKTSELKAKKEGAKALTTKGKEKVAGGEKVGEKQETETTTGQQQQGVSPKLFAPFFEVRAAQTHSAFNFFVRPIGTDQYVVFLVFRFTLYALNRRYNKKQPDIFSPLLPSLG